MTKSTAAGSMSPQRVPMTRPSSGVNPMLVSTLRPPWTAVMLHPFPRWQVTIRSRSAGSPRNRAAASETYLWLMP